MMFTRALRAGLPVILAGTVGVSCAHADIYTWIDQTGMVNVSNLAPPDGVRVTKVTHETPPAPVPRAAPRDDMARDAARDAELQALNARVAQLQDEVDRATREASGPVAYQDAQIAPDAQYAVDWAPPASYSDAPQPVSAGCDPTWINCAIFAGALIYPVPVVLLRVPYFRHPVKPPHRVGSPRHIVPPQPVHAGSPLRPPPMRTVQQLQARQPVRTVQLPAPQPIQAVHLPAPQPTQLAQVPAPQPVRVVQTAPVPQPAPVVQAAAAPQPVRTFAVAGRR